MRDKIDKMLNDSYLNQKDKTTVILTGTDINKRIMDLIKETCERVIGADDKLEDFPQLKRLSYGLGEAAIDLVNDTKKEQRARLKKELNDK